MKNLLSILQIIISIQIIKQTKENKLLKGIITEVKEELGLDFSKEDFILYDSGCDGKDCYKMYFVKKDINLNDIKIQEDELSEVRWFSIDELKLMVETKELNEDQIACFLKVCDYLDKR